MLENTKKIVDALNSVASTVQKSGTTNQSLRDVIGWSAPAFGPADLARLASRLADRIEAIPDSRLSDTFSTDQITQRTLDLQANVVPQLWNGNGLPAYHAYKAQLDYVESVYASSFANSDWEAKLASEEMPRALAQNLRSIKAQINKLTKSADDLDQKVRAINEAHEAAVALPTDLEAVREAQEELSGLGKTAGLDQAAIARMASDSAKLFEQIEASEREAQGLVVNIGSAYSAATTQGLAGAFGERATALQTTTWVWVGLLFVALLSGAVVGYLRLSYLQTLIDKPTVSPEALWISAGMSFLAIAAPLWFAWLATKQIAQRFRLSEDYAFKASVARAYEGYRREAARLDEKLEARLFASALDRLEEQPLRFISTEEHSTPYQELLNSPGFQRALEKFPDVRASLLELAKRAGGKNETPDVVE